MTSHTGRKITLLLAVLALATGCGRKSVTEPDIICGRDRQASSGAPKHDPIIFIHGYGGNSDDFCPMIDRFRADGWTDNELYAYDYSLVASHATGADEIRGQVDRILAVTGAQKVDIIAYSAGSVSSRYYLRTLGGDSQVDAWVSLAGPNHGTETALNCSFPPCLEIRVGSAFLANLNSGDETPGFPRYSTWWSPCDDTINPDASVPLAGASNHQTACIAHIQFLVDPVVYQQVRDWTR